MRLRGFFRRAWRVVGPRAVLALAVLGPVTPSEATVVLASDFGRQLAPWIVLGDGGRIEQANESVDGIRKPVLAYRYELGKGRLQVLAWPIGGGALAAASTLTFSARPSQLVSLMVVLEEQGGGRWTTVVTLPGGKWSPVRLSTADFVLSTDAGDPPDANGRLDLDKVKTVSFIDTAALLAATSPDAVRFFSIDARPRSLLLADVAFGSPDGAAPVATSRSVDGFGASQLPWMVFGATTFDYGAATAAPLKSRGVSLRYERKAGIAASAMRRLPRDLLAGAHALTLSIGSAAKTSVLVKLEQADGGKFEASIDLPGDSALHERVLRTADFRKSDDTKKGVDRLDWGQVTQLAIVDAAGFFTPHGDNRLWLAGVTSDAAPAAAQGSTVPPSPPAASTVRVATPGWAAWTKRVDPVLSGPVSLVGDPSVMRDGPLLRMIYNCFDTTRKRGAVCQATSTDGLAWTNVPNGDSLPGRMIHTRPGEWDDAQETPFMIKFGGEYLLYFVGYKDRGGFFNSFPAYVGMAVSRDGTTFQRPILDPVVKTTPGGYDNDAISSPSVVEYQGKLVMLYTAHCWTTCPNGKGMSLMAATSTDGRTWTKADKPVLTKADFPNLKDGMAEAEVDRGPDGQYYLFFSMFYGDNAHEIGVAQAPSPFGPWTIDPEAIVRRSKDGFDAVGPIAPSVVFDGDRVRMWFHGFSKHNTIEIGYAEAPWPLRGK